MQMTGQEHVDPLAGELLHRFGARPGASERRASVRLVEWMVRDEVGPDCPDCVAHGVDDDGIDAAEMQVREMNDGAHYGTMTRSARGRIRNASGLLSVTISPSIDAWRRATPASSVTDGAVNDSKPSRLRMFPNTAAMIMRATPRRLIPGAMHT